MELDHVAVNAKTGLTDLERVFRGFGFDLSPRGFHSLGSMNHVAVLSGSYLELVGVPKANPDVRPEISSGHTGIDGLVFRTDDAHRTQAELQAAGFKPGEVQEFSRPVAADGSIAQARFRTVRLPPGLFGAGRIYFCEHLTPELIWKDGTLGHPNGSRRISEVVVVSANPVEAAWRYATLAQTEPEFAEGGRLVPFQGFAVRVLSLESYAAIYRGNALSAGGEPEFFGAMVIQTTAGRGAIMSIEQDWKRSWSRDGVLRLSSEHRRILIEFDHARGQ